MAILSTIRSRLILLVLALLTPAALLILSTAHQNRTLELEQARARLLDVAQQANADLQEAVHDARTLHFMVGLLPALYTADAAQCSRILKLVHAQTQNYTDIVATDHAGVRRCSAVSGEVPVTGAGDRAYFDKMLTTKRLVVDAPLTSRSTGKPALPIAGPLLNGEGEVVGALVMPIDLTLFGERLVKNHLTEDLRFHLWDGGGKILFRYPDAERLTGKSFPDLPLVRLTAEQGGRGVVDAVGFDGVERVIGYSAPNGLYADAGIYVGVTAPAKLIYAAPDAIMVRAYWSMLGLMLGGLTAAWLLGSRLIWRQIDAITKAARKMAMGQTSVRIGRPYSKNEIGELARAFDAMAATAEAHAQSLETANVNLEQRVLQRTQSLLDSETSLKRSNRMLRMLSICNEALVRSHSEAMLLDAICRHIVEMGGYRLAWVGFALQDEGQSVVAGAQFGVPGYVEQIKITWNDTEWGRGPVGTAVREARSVIVRDIAADPSMRPWLETARSFEFASVLALPLMGHDAVLGVLAIYSAEKDLFDAPEVKLLEELAADLAYGIASLRETGRRTRAEHQLDYQVTHDALTALPNRSLFLDRAHQALVHAQRAQQQVAVLLLDLDRFKTINDSFGRDAGDYLLREVSQRLTAALRDGDTVARLTVDEFGVLIDEVTNSEDMLPLAQKLLRAVALPVPFTGDDVSEMFVTCSVGISVYPRDGDTAEQLLAHADTAMHSAKSLGGNTVQFYASDMNHRLSTRIVLEGALRRALELSELQVYYQPKVNLQSGNVVGAEALVRWPHPVRGMVSPVDFIPLAEETGLIVPLGTWVLNAACAHMRLWLDRGLAVPPVAVNLSARQFMQPDLIEVIRRALETNRLEAHRLEVEITESTAMLNIDKAAQILSTLKALGIRISLDDFGTGYSSLSYLKRFPIDHLKIDRAFVRDITTDPDDAMICKAVIGLAHNLKMSVIAEGVETEGQMRYLRDNHCDEMQGYLFSRPLPADDYYVLLAEGSSLTMPLGEDVAQRTVLLVDDEENVLNALKRLLRRSGYTILTATSAAEGFELLATNTVQVIISDQRMPAMDGTVFLSRVKELYPDPVRMVLSGYTELKSVTDAINEGAVYKFLTKPWEDDELKEHLKEAFRFYDTQKRKAS